MIEGWCSNVSTHALPYGSIVYLLLQKLRLDFGSLPYESMPRMQPMHMKHSIEKQTEASSSHRSTKSSQLGDIYAICKVMNKQLKIVHQQCDRLIAIWKTLNPNALPPTPSYIDDEEDVDDGGGDEKDIATSIDGEE